MLLHGFWSNRKRRMYILFPILFAILFSILCTILFATLYAITMQIFFLNMGPVMGQWTHTSPMTSSTSSHSDISERFRSKGRTVARILQRCVKRCRSAADIYEVHYYPFLQVITPHPLLNTFPNIQILELKFRKYYPFSCTSLFRG